MSVVSESANFEMNLVPENDTGVDFSLKNNYAWVSTEHYSIQIVDDADELRVRVYPLGDEHEEIDAVYIAK